MLQKAGLLQMTHLACNSRVCTCREDLVRELQATVGEKQQLGQQLTNLALKFEAAQSMWERHVEKDENFSSLVTEEVLDKVVDALTERKKNAGQMTSLVDLEMRALRALDTDILASKFRIFPEEAASAILQVQSGPCHILVHRDWSYTQTCCYACLTTQLSGHFRRDLRMQN